jgi:hypothetical protein
MEGAIDEMAVTPFGQRAGRDLLVQFELRWPNSSSMVSATSPPAWRMISTRWPSCCTVRVPSRSTSGRPPETGCRAGCPRPAARAARRAPGHRRHRHDFHHFAEIGHQPALADAVAHATPQVLGELPFGQLHRMGQAAPFVGFKDVEGRAHQATSSLIRAISSSSRGGLTM